MDKIGDIKKKVKFAFFPVKIAGSIIWLKKYVDVYEYKQFHRRRALPVEGICYEDGSPVYDKVFSKYETYSYEMWIKIGKDVINKKS